MVDRRPICGICEVSMIVHKNGVRIKYGDSDIQSGDLYRCPECLFEIITACSLPKYIGTVEVEMYDYERKPREEY